MSETEGTALAEHPLRAKVEQRIGEYIECREAIAAIKEKHEQELAPLVDLQNKLTGWLQRLMDQAGATSIKSEKGTCYTSTKYTASLADPQAFMKYVIETNQFELLDRKANVTAVKDHVKEKGGLPPGCGLSAIETVGVRRPSAKAS